MNERPDQIINVPPMGECVGIHGRGCAGLMYRNRFGIEYCSWCGWSVPLVPVSRLTDNGKGQS